jgi:hypothetical protein
VDWVPRESPTAIGINGVAYGNGRFVAMGIGVLTSEDGVNWAEQQLGANRGQIVRGIAYGDGQFVVAGTQWNANYTAQEGIILTSTDGANWIQRQLPTTSPLNGIGYGNGRFVSVGDYQTILVSGSIVTLGIMPNDQTGRLTLSVTGPNHLDYTIQTSADLISWRNLTNLVGAPPSSVILDKPTPGSSREFYRVYSQ